MTLEWVKFDTWLRQRYLRDRTDYWHARDVAFVSEGHLRNGKRWHAWLIQEHEDDYMASFETEKEAMEFLEVLVKLESA